MGDVEREGGDVLGDGFGVGPDPCAFFAGDVLDDFVEDFGDDEGVVGGGGVGGGCCRGVALVGEVGADGDEEGTALGRLAWERRGGFGGGYKLARLIPLCKDVSDFFVA